MIRAVLFVWRGTLVVNMTDVEWVERALSALGRRADRAAVEGIASAIARANGPGNRLDAPGVDCDAALHRRTFLDVLADAGLDAELVEALYAVESDPRNNPFVGDVADTFASLRDGDVRIAVVSDIHVDLRPAFDAARLGGLVDVFTLSFEQGVQKPDPLMFTRTLDALGVGPGEALMVGDRSRPDGAAVESGIPTLLVPPLRSVEDRRLHLVLSLCGIG
ncbi:Phosphoglycolate phosphatase, HAD superfamily [Blastococcus aurantiacus]|uniref:Phosphoglycolate phosphatase, HAD superfamily n=1 Tax=Blastococcus aurantiacus TaxID=1550231 RepID=A0A1G7KEQ8_9ACTN|nr:HAD family hydrolase [Blastococcus aurantiacus]SDF35713.1 Phosphoglycolate phosphatase, HAD superfamily [Blastococcus aurantiacus]